MSGAKTTVQKKNALKVLLVGAECVPFVKTGGLADVMGTLPAHLKAMGADVRVMLPKHGIIKHEYGDQLKCLATFYVQLGWRNQYVGVETLQKDGITYYFIDNEYYFYYSVYKGGEAELEQYAYFSRAVIEALPAIGFIPDVIHVNDWHTAMIPMLLKTQYGGRPQEHIKTVLTIHNLQYQGKCSFAFMNHFLGVPERFFTYEYVEAYGDANFLKAGIVFADKITTVSPTYAQEIRNSFFGCGLEGILQKRGDDLVGIVNGINTAEFDPENDPYIKHPYSHTDLAGKKACKQDLMDVFQLSVSPDTPIVSMVTRMTEQKGLDLVRRVLEELLHEDMAFIILGTGDMLYQDYFHYIAEKYPDNSGVYIAYGNELAHKIYAGSDLFLMPSHFEPCGISQMIAQRYGTLPVVRETGGLKDTVMPYNKYTGEGDGFSFANYNAHEMKSVLELAMDTIRDPKTHRKLMVHAMQKDNSFETSAKRYLEIYRKLKK